MRCIEVLRKKSALLESSYYKSYEKRVSYGPAGVSGWVGG